MLKLVAVGQPEVVSAFARASTAHPSLQVVAASVVDEGWAPSDWAEVGADAVCFLTPCPALADVIRQTASSGRHVIVAGPPTEDEGAFNRLASTCRDAGVALVAAGALAAASHNQALSSLVENGQFGIPAFLRLVDIGPTGGDLYWQTAEAIALANTILGSGPESVYALAVESPAGAVSHLSLSLGYPNAITALLAVGTCESAACHLEVSILLGDTGAGAYDSTRSAPLLVGESSVWNLNADRAERMASWIAALGELISKGDRLTDELERARVVAAAVAATRKSLATGKPVPIPAPSSWAW